MRFVPPGSPAFECYLLVQVKENQTKDVKLRGKKRPQRDFSLYYKIHDIKHVLEILYVLTVMAALNMAFVHAPFAPL